MHIWHDLDKFFVILLNQSPQYKRLPVFLLGADKSQSQILKKTEEGQKKNEGLGVDLKSSCHRYLPGGLLCSLPKCPL